MTAPTTAYPAARGADVSRFPVLGPLLRWRHLRSALQSVMLLMAILVIYDGFTGSPVAPKNVAGVAPWIQWRGFTVLSLLLVGSLFCMACPFMLTRRLAKRFLPGDRAWPRRLQGKWLAATLLALFFWFYEAFAPWAQPWLTAALALAYFAAAFAIDGVFKGAAFCKQLCPIGQFNFVQSTCSPMEVGVRSRELCNSCDTKSCITGRSLARGHSAHVPDGGGSIQPAASHGTVGAHANAARQSGCELWLFQQQKVGNLDCTFCLECMHACPYGNVGVMSRMPGRELWQDVRRAGVGWISRRTDLALLILVLVFGALLNAFGMVGPFYGFEAWLSELLHVDARWAVLLVLDVVALFLLPVSLVALAAWATRALVGTNEALSAIATGFSFSLIPVGFGMWAAHYGYHFMTGALTLIPVVQNLLLDLGIPFLGAPRWDLAAIVPPDWLVPIELVLLEAGLLGSLVVAYRIAVARYEDDLVGRRAFVPWAALALAFFAAGVWLMLQPMEMRGVLRAG